MHKKVPQPWAKNHPEKKIKQETDSCYSSKKPTGFLQTIRVEYDVVCLEVFQYIFGATWCMYLELLQPKQGSFGLSLLESKGFFRANLAGGSAGVATQEPKSKVRHSGWVIKMKYINIKMNARFYFIGYLLN